MTFEIMTLDGCAPTPLASYLKALGVLRLISSDTNHVDGRAVDPKARGWWGDERFHIRTTLDRAALCRFFLNDYAPSPIIAPWNGRAGFLEGDAGDANDTKMRPKAQRVAEMETSESPRFGNLRTTISASREESSISQYNSFRTAVNSIEKQMKAMVGEEKSQAETKKKEAERSARTAKEFLLPRLRSNTDALHVTYIDACYALSMENFPAPLLVGGGVDGSRDFGSDFIETLGNLFDLDGGTPHEQATGELTGSLFATCERSERRGSLGLFTPMQSGLKSTTGFEVGGDKAIYPLNSWDVVFAMEGAMVFAGTLTRRWGATGDSRAAFPFTFDPVGAGAGGLSVADPNRPRGEIWTPLWNKPATYSEVSAVFSEGRLTLGRRAARTGLDAARSVARIGQARGIGSFERYSLIQPDSKMPYQATPLGRFTAPTRPRPDLIADLEAGGWLESARRHAGSATCPAHAKSAMRRLQDALFQMTDAGQSGAGTRNALIALGGFVRWIVTNRNAREGLRLPPVVSRAWILAADDDSPEFRVATALAGLGLAGHRPGGAMSVATGAADDTPGTQTSSKVPPMASHLAPIDEDRYSIDRRAVWSASAMTPNVVWGTGNLVTNMIAILERRLVEATIRGLQDKPFAGAVNARLDDAAAFLSGDFDDSRCAALLAGLIWVHSTHPRMDTNAPASPVPFAYAALKPIFTPDEALRRIGVLTATARLPVPPGLVLQLRAGDNRLDGRASDAAVRIALARARGSGIPSPFDPARSGGRPGVVERSRYGAGVRSDRLAAALLIPIGDHALKILVNRAYPGATAEPNTEPMEATTNAD